MFSMNLPSTERNYKTDLEILAESLAESVPEKDQSKDFPPLWISSRTGLAHSYSRVLGTNTDDQQVEVHYLRELSLDKYNLKSLTAQKQYGARKTRQFLRLFQEAISHDQPNQEEIKAIKQVFENVYEERVILKKSPIYRNTDPKEILSFNPRFVTDTITIPSNGLIRYSIERFDNNPFNLNFQNPEIPEEKTEYFGYDPKTSYLRDGHFELAIPLLSKGPIPVTPDSIEEIVRKSLQSLVNQNQEEIKAGTIKSLELLFLNKGDVQDLFFYFYKWLRKKI
jgi:hypothetical protein